MDLRKFYPGHVFLIRVLMWYVMLGCESVIVDTYVCMCLQIDSLRINGTRDRDGKNSSPVGKIWQEIKRERSEWVVWTLKLWITGKKWKGQHDPCWPFTPIYMIPLRSSVGLNHFSLFSQHQKYCVPMRLSFKLQPRSVNLGSTAPSELHCSCPSQKEKI